MSESLRRSTTSFLRPVRSRPLRRSSRGYRADDIVSTCGAAPLSALACLQGTSYRALPHLRFPVTHEGDPHGNITGPEQATRRCFSRGDFVYSPALVPIRIEHTGSHPSWPRPASACGSTSTSRDPTGSRGKIRLCGGDARNGGGLGEMTRRKRKSSALRANGTSHIWLSSHFSREAFMVFSHRLAFHRE
jgi:hypothetical protein